MNVQQMVMAKYPREPRELKCRPYREYRNGLRELYRERLEKAGVETPADNSNTHETSTKIEQNK